MGDFELDLVLDLNGHLVGGRACAFYAELWGMSTTNLRGKRRRGRRFYGCGIFFRQSRRQGKFLGPRIALQNACQKENEGISTRPFLLWHFFPGHKIENCSAQFLAVCWFVHFEL